ncbi:MAG: BamA/TamA family outer membrane protein [Cyanobacteria bacterium P01_H01_bin.105]
MQTTLLVVSRLSRQYRWLLATTLGVTAGPVLLASPSWGQTDTPLMSPPSDHSSGATDTTETTHSPQEPQAGIQENTGIDPSYIDNLSNTPSATVPSATVPSDTVPSDNGEVLSDIQVRFVDGHVPTEAAISPDIITQAFELQPGDVYNAQLALEGLARLQELVSHRTTLTLEPTEEPNQVVMVVNVAERNSFFVDLGSSFPRPSALQGPARPATVNALSNQPRGFSPAARFGFENIGGNNQTLSLTIEGGENTLGADLDFRQFLNDGSGYGINFANRRGVEPEFVGGDPEVETPSGDEPWVHRMGGGVEYFRPLTSDLDAALGLSYQRISVREDVFDNDVVGNDEFGNSLTVSDDGQDDLLTLNFAGVIDQRNDSKNPTKGSRLLFGLDQSIPVGEAEILFTRLSANYTQFLPLNLFGFTAGPRTLVLNLQGGTILGDTPPYDAFSLGGSSSVRGYGSGEVGTGESFVQATAEYRFPMFGFNAFDDDIDVGGTLFFDYASDLGTGDEVIGEPAEVRGKPGDGFGYGLGVRAMTSIGAVRLEFGINDEGDTRVIFKIGDRF